MPPRILDFCMVPERMASGGTHQSTTVCLISHFCYMYRVEHILATPTPSTVLGVVFGVESSGDVRICDTPLEPCQTCYARTNLCN